MTATALGSNPAYSLQSVQATHEQSLLTDTAQLAGGKRITTAAIDPLGLAVYNTLTEQAQGDDAANVNLSDATDAVSVAQGAAAGASSATPTYNGAVDAGGAVLTTVSASPATTGGTFVATVDASGNAALTYTDSSTQTTTAAGSFAAGTSTTYDGTTIRFGSFSAQDAGASATVQTTAATPAATPTNIDVQSGPSEGQTANVSSPNATTNGLGITNVDLNTPAATTNTEGQIRNAETNLSLGEAKLGGETASLGAASANNSILSNNVTAAASSIGDAGIGQNVTNQHQTLLQQQISFALLAHANVNAGHLNAFLSTYA